MTATAPNCATTNAPNETFREFRAFAKPCPEDTDEVRRGRPVFLVTQFRNYLLAPDEARALAAQLIAAAEAAAPPRVYTLRVTTAPGVNAAKVGAAYTGEGATARDAVNAPLGTAGPGTVFIDCKTAEIRRGVVMAMDVDAWVITAECLIPGAGVTGAH